MSSSITEKFTLWAMGLCAALRIGKFVEQPDHQTHLQGIRSYEFRLAGRPLNACVTQYEGRVVVFRKHPPTARGDPASSNHAYHATLVDGRVATILRHDPPHVIGTGHLSLRALTEIENKIRSRGPTLHTIPVHIGVTRELARHGLSWEHVPRAGQYVALGTSVDPAAGGSTHDVTHQAHPHTIALLESIGREHGRALMGIHITIPDITTSWSEQSQKMRWDVLFTSYM